VDEAFVPLHGIVRGLTPTGGNFWDEEAGVHSYIYRFEIESPVELDVARDEHGVAQIGSTPPLYYVETSLRPSFHHLRFIAELDEDVDGSG